MKRKKLFKKWKIKKTIKEIKNIKLKPQITLSHKKEKTILPNFSSDCI